MKRMLIDAAHEDEMRVVILDHDRVQDYDFVTSAKAQVKGNIYLAKITRVEPSLQAAFVEYGGGKQGFLPFSEIHPDYYQLPAEDKQKLLAEQIAEAEAEEAAEDAAFEREQAARDARRGRRGHQDADDSEEDFPDEEEDFTAGRDAEPAAAPALLAPETSAEDSNLPVVESFTPPQDEALEDEKTNSPQPMETASYAVHSDVVEALPEDSAPTEGQNTEATSADEQSDGTTSEDAEETRPRRGSDQGGRGIHRRYRIQEVIKRNQIVLVQVIKEERGNKGCSLTSYISLAGRYAVLMPNSPKGGGISRKITDRETRRSLKELAGSMRTHRGMSVIIRTAGLDRTKAEIKRDYEYLVKLWNEIREKTLSSTAPALIYEEGNLIKRSLRDLYTANLGEVIVEGEEAFQEAKNFMKMLMPSHAARIKLYKDNIPLYSYAGIEEQLSAMTEPQVKLPSGGYLVINPTEALISIDVNSGRSTTERNVEETALKTNLEAAAEVARQLRLRDLAGLIVIDFIDMNYGKNRKAVERAMKDAVKHDRAKIALGRISMFGLLELSRQRMRPSISESMGIICPHCNGTGYVHSVETVGIQIIRTLEKEAASGEFSVLRVATHPEAALHLLNDKRALLQSIEERYQVSVVVLMDSAMTTGQYRMIKVTIDGKEVAHEDGKQPRRSRRGRRGGKEVTTGSGRRERSGSLNFNDVVEPVDPSEFIEEAPLDDEDNEVIGSASALKEESEETVEGGDRPRRTRRRRGGRTRERGERKETPALSEGEAPPSTGETAATDGDESDTRGERGGRRRGRRGGRNRKRGERSSPDGSIGNPFPSDGDAAAPAESHRDTQAPSQPAAATTPAPAKPSRVIPLSEAQTNPAAIASPLPESDASKPKRRGWWSKVLES